MGRFSAGSIVGEIDFDRTKGARAIAAVKGDVRDLKQDVDKNMAGVKEAIGQAGVQGGQKFKQAMGALKEDFGKGSLLGQGLKLAAGGGAVAALNMLSMKMRGLGADLRDLSEHWNDAGVSQEETMTKMVGAIPILGNVVLAMHDVEEAITGQAARIKDNTEQWKRYQDVLKETAKLQAEGVGAKVDGLGRARLRADDESFVLSKPKGMQRDIAQELTNSWEEDADLGQIAAKAIKDLGIDEVQKKIDEEVEKHGAGTYTGMALQDQKAELINQQKQIEEELGRAREAVEKKTQARISDLKQAAIESDLATQQKAVDDAFDEMQQRSDRVKGLFDDLQKEVDQSGMTDLQKRFDDVRRSGLLNPEELQQYQTMLDQVGGIEASKKTLPTERLRPIQAQELRGTKFVTQADVNSQKQTELQSNMLKELKLANAKRAAAEVGDEVFATLP
jgi:hypothetical protein